MLTNLATSEEVIGRGFIRFVGGMLHNQHVLTDWGRDSPVIVEWNERKMGRCPYSGATRLEGSIVPDFYRLVGIEIETGARFYEYRAFNNTCCETQVGFMEPRNAQDR